MLGDLTQLVVHDVAEALGVSEGSLTYTEAINAVKAQADAARAKLGQPLATAVDELRQRVVALEMAIRLKEGTMESFINPKPPVFTQMMLPVSIETNCDGNYYPPRKYKIILKGLVLAVNSELMLEMDVTSPFVCQLAAAVRTRKMYKLTLEETEGTF